MKYTTRRSVISETTEHTVIRLGGGARFRLCRGEACGNAGSGPADQAGPMISRDGAGNYIVCICDSDPDDGRTAERTSKE